MRLSPVTRRPMTPPPRKAMANAFAPDWVRGVRGADVRLDSDPHPDVGGDEAHRRAYDEGDDDPWVPVEECLWGWRRVLATMAMVRVLPLEESLGA